MTDEDIKRLTDRAKVVQSYIDEERQRIRGLIEALDERAFLYNERAFLYYCIDNSYTVSEVSRARELYDQSNDDIESLM